MTEYQLTPSSFSNSRFQTAGIRIKSGKWKKAAHALLTPESVETTIQELDTHRSAKTLDALTPPIAKTPAALKPAATTMPPRTPAAMKPVAMKIFMVVNRAEKCKQR